MKVAILKAGRVPDSLQSEHGDYDGMCRRLLGYDAAGVTTYSVLDNQFPSAPDNYDLYIITGSRYGVYDSGEWIKTLISFVRRADEAGSKLIGLCFGHQVIAEALGGHVEKSGKGYGIGVMEYEYLRGIGKIYLCAWHQDQVITPPPSAELIMTSDFCRHAGFRYGNRALSFQPHPEFSQDFVKDLIYVRVGDTISQVQADAAFSTLSRATDASFIQDMIRVFLLRSIGKVADTGETRRPGADEYMRRIAINAA